MLKRVLQRSTRLYSTIPFDQKPFPFSRFEPCCPDLQVKKAENGFIPCQAHPMPAVLGKKIELEEEMTGPSGLRHIVACVGDGLEWTRAKVETVPGIMQTIMNLENHWLKTERPTIIEGSDMPVLKTITDKPSVTEDKVDIMLFPEFKLITSVDPLHADKDSRFDSILNSIWKNPSLPIPDINELKDIKADSIVLVCTHTRRDMRCGKIGPLIIEEFRRVIQEQGLTNVEVWGTSHFGGKVYYNIKRARNIRNL